MNKCWWSDVCWHVGNKLGSTLVRYMHIDQLGIIIGRLLANPMNSLDLLKKRHEIVILLDAEQVFNLDRVWIYVQCFRQAQALKIRLTRTNKKYKYGT